MRFKKISWCFSFYGIGTSNFLQWKWYLYDKSFILTPNLVLFDWILTRSIPRSSEYLLILENIFLHLRLMQVLWSLKIVQVQILFTWNFQILMQFHHFRTALYHIRLKSGRLRVMPEAHFHKDVDSRYPSLAIMIKSVSQSETKFDTITFEFQKMKCQFFVWN